MALFVPPTLRASLRASLPASVRLSVSPCLSACLPASLPLSLPPSDDDARQITWTPSWGGPPASNIKLSCSHRYPASLSWHGSGMVRLF